jgi:hypothetical protein
MLMFRGTDALKHITKSWQKALERFQLNPSHHMAGLNMLESQDA